jgi:hypothetical protein
MDQALQRLAALSGSASIRALEGNELLMERAWLTGARFASGRSSSGATRFINTADGVVAITLARADDWALLPAWLETGEPDFQAVCESAGSNAPEAVEHAWRNLAAQARGKDTRRLVDQGRALGLPVAATGPHREPLHAHPRQLPGFSGSPASASGPGRNGRPPKVVDLSALWAGPLCTHLLQLCGAEVIKVESSSRPDGARRGHTGFYDLLNQGKRSVALDPGNPEGIRALRLLIDSADVLIESSRPRALRQLGVIAEEVLEQKPKLIWISLTGYGRAEPRANWTAFGDDAGVAAGLSDLMRRATGSYQLMGDAIADPLTGAHAALAAWQAWSSGQGGMIELALTEIVVGCLHSALEGRTERELLEANRRWWASVADKAAPIGYVGRHVRSPAAALGADTDAVLAEISARC